MCKCKRSFFNIVILILVMMLPLPVTADEPVKEGVDVVLLIDTSGSMRSSDQSRNAIEAVNMFVDMLQTKYSRVSVLAFNDEISHVVDMTEVNSVRDKEKIKNVVNKFEYDGFTDIGVSLKEGVNKLLNDVRPENSPMILLLTDGKIELDPERSDRTEDDAYHDITEALAMASKTFPIYTIGLNYDDSVDEELLQAVSSTTDGRSYIINEADTLPQIFNEIFADHVESSLMDVASFTADGEMYNEVKIGIESDFVSEANIIILSGKELADVKLTDPSGVEADFNQETITYSKSNRYSIIKVIMPVRGEWTLAAKGVKDDKIRVNLLYQYDVSVEMSVSQNGTTPDLYDSLAPIQITGDLIVNGKPYNGVWLYDETTTSLIVKHDKDILDTIPVEVNDGKFFVEYTPQTEDNITLFIKTEHEHFAKNSNTSDIRFEHIEVAPSTSPTPSPTHSTIEDVQQEDTPETNEPISKASLIFSAVIVVVLITLVAAFLLFYPWRHSVGGGKRMFFTGHIEMRMRDSNGKYTPMEAPLLSTYVNSFTMQQFITENLKQGTVNKLLKMPIDWTQIILYPGKEKGVSVLNIDNKTSCQILKGNSDQNTDEKKLVWRSGDHLVLITDSKKNAAKLEMTYRTEEN